MKTLFLTTIITIAVAAASAKADIDTVYQMTVGTKMSHIFEGAAKKVVVTSLTGATELKVKYAHRRESKHKIRCNPRCSKTISSGALDGIVNIQAKSKSGRTVTLKVEVDKKENVRCRIPSDCGAAEGWEVYRF